MAQQAALAHKTTIPPMFNRMCFTSSAIAAHVLMIRRLSRIMLTTSKVLACPLRRKTPVQNSS
eukprot:CAMPEP_0176218520 /NCGR_PEP_ID=MMETSP0121_2-20121125/18243_1 /TAXON_ID=160619 /ORGANISM="Kryptoperidinium foliaceum, Strain CCMP 1326" /LENGTH=62 /DNA_ID=CAMNT_0017557669 /DNA_START=47 /DNA_END=235 /DNA_ORIENTATION=+